jgi:hypothetical protein
MMMPVEYRLVDGFPAYCVGSDGTVWSRYSTDGNGNVILSNRWNRVTHYLSKQGYPRITLSKDGAKVGVMVHKLVLEAFVGPRPQGKEARHLDGNRQNNRLDNLCWSTHVENCADKVAHGTNICGERHYLAKLTNRKVKDIRAAIANGHTQRKIAEMFGVSQRLVHKIHKREAWKHVPDD